MTPIEQLKKDIATFRRLDKRHRWLFIWDYYRIPIISVLIIAAIGAAVAFGVMRDDKDLYIVMVNANREVVVESVPTQLEKNGIDLAGMKIDVETSYTLKYEDFTQADVQTVEVLAVRFGIGDLDVFAADEPVFRSYAEKDAFVDLSLFIPKDVLGSKEADLYRYRNSDGHEIVGGIWLRKGSPLHEAGLYSGDVLIGVAALAENLDNALLFIRNFFD
ncbi:MAG: hypothetical protein GX193_08810 [Clostridiales bacterium]|nr:hypothetical protein [Clostridiales bacterium]